MFSRTMIAPGPPVSASVWRTTRPSAWTSSPACSASFIASQAAAYEVKVNMLRASFIRVPAPGAPAWMTIEAHCLKAGLIRSYTERSAPTMVAISPFSAAPAPPLTGASMTWISVYCSASSAAVVSLIVEWIAITVPGLARSANCPTTSRTCSSLRTTTLIRSASATSVTAAAAVAPASTNGSMASARRSNTVRPPGQSSNRLAIGAPMLPRPMNPSFSSLLMTG